MENLYIKRKKEISQKIVINFSSIGIANLCDYVICDRYDDNYGKKPPSVYFFYLNSLQQGDKLFLNGLNLHRYPEIVNFLKKILSLKKIKLKFYIGVIEPTLSNNIINILLPYAIKIYVTNNTHPKCSILPIGLRDGEEVHPNHINFSGKQILNELAIDREKELLCLLCFSGTHSDRKICRQELEKKSYVCNLHEKKNLCWENKGGTLKSSKQQQSIHCGDIPQWIFYEYCHRSYYTLSPRGAGQDTHRFFEAIALHSIPIVKKTNTVFDKTFDFFPCLVLSNWSECTEELLKTQLLTKQKELQTFHQEYPDYLTNVDTIKKIFNNL